MIDLSDGTNDSLFSPTTVKLGEIHWYLLKAHQLMEEATTRTRKDEKGWISVGRTDFGQEVGRDEIHWW